MTLKTCCASLAFITFPAYSRLPQAAVAAGFCYAHQYRTFIIDFPIFICVSDSLRTEFPSKSLPTG